MIGLFQQTWLQLLYSVHSSCRHLPMIRLWKSPANHNDIMSLLMPFAAVLIVRQFRPRLKCGWNGWIQPRLKCSWNFINQPLWFVETFSTARLKSFQPCGWFQPLQPHFNQHSIHRFTVEFSRFSRSSTETLSTVSRLNLTASTALQPRLFPPFLSVAQYLKGC